MFPPQYILIKRVLRAIKMMDWRNMVLDLLPVDSGFPFVTICDAIGWESGSISAALQRDVFFENGFFDWSDPVYWGWVYIFKKCNGQPTIKWKENERWHVHHHFFLCNSNSWCERCIFFNDFWSKDLTLMGVMGVNGYLTLMGSMWVYLNYFFFKLFEIYDYLFNLYLFNSISLESPFGRNNSFWAILRKLIGL